MPFFRQRFRLTGVHSLARLCWRIVHLRPVTVWRPLFVRRRIRTRMLGELRILRLWILRLRFRHWGLSDGAADAQGNLGQNPATYVLGSDPPSASPLGPL